MVRVHILILCWIDLYVIDFWSVINLFVRALVASGNTDELNIFIWNNHMIRIVVLVIKIIVLIILEVVVSPTRVLVFTRIERVVLAHSPGSVPSFVGIHGVHRHRVVKSALTSADDTTRRVRDLDGRLLLFV